MARRATNKQVTVSVNWLECFILEPIKFEVRRPRKIFINQNKPYETNKKKKGLYTQGV